MIRTAILAPAAVLLLTACGRNDGAGEANQAAAPADVDVLPPDESAATPSDDLVNGAIDNNSAASPEANGAVNSSMPQ
jgi:hypothetical protein